MQMQMPQHILEAYQKLGYRSRPNGIMEREDVRVQVEFDQKTGTWEPRQVDFIGLGVSFVQKQIEDLRKQYDKPAEIPAPIVTVAPVPVVTPSTVSYLCKAYKGIYIKTIPPLAKGKDVIVKLGDRYEAFIPAAEQMITFSIACDEKGVPKPNGKYYKYVRPVK